jgi:hypothetical protein
LLSWFRKEKQRPTASTVMKRVIILRHVFVKGYATPPVDQLTLITSQWTDEEWRSFDEHSRSLAATQIEKLRASGLWGEMEEDERAFIQAPPGEMAPQQQVDAIWLAEPVLCLRWALGHFQDLPSYDQQASEELMKGAPGETVRDLLNGSRLRAAAEIDRQRDLAELWHWRCRTRQLTESKKMPEEIAGGMTIEEAIREAATRGGEEFKFTVIGDDFAILGRPFRDATEEEFSVVLSIARERHKAFNWLCGYAPANCWSKTPTGT